MQTLMPEQQNSDDLLIFFTGWGMNEAATAHLKTGNFDFCLCHDYSRLPDSFPVDLSNYKHIYLVGWSLGVWAAASLMTSCFDKIKFSLAINGTMAPVSDGFGIPEMIYEKTYQYLDPDNLKKFFLRMCGDKKSYDFFMEKKPGGNVDQLKMELQQIRGRFMAKGIPLFHWNAAIGGLNDRIFPHENLKQFWSARTNFFSLPIPHYPFHLWTGWDELIRQFNNEANG